MSGVRRRVSLVALVWLLSHVSTLGLSFAGLCCNVPAMAAAVGEDDDACCKGLAPGQICPLHKHQSHHSKRPAPSPGDCTMRSGCDSTAMTLPTLLLGPGLLPAVAEITDQATTIVPTFDAAPPLARSVLPDLPPPRA